jgi:hypothetical protein
MEPSVEILIGMMVVLVLISVGLVAYLMREMRKKEPGKTPAAPPAEDVAVEMEQASSDPLSPAEGSADPVAAPDGAHQPIAQPADPERTAGQPSAPVVLRQPVSAGEPGADLLMQVWQDREGYLVVEVEGRRYRRLFDVRDGEAGRRLLETINRLVVFSRGQESRVTPAPPAEMPAPSTAAVAAPATAAVESGSQTLLDSLQEQEEEALKKSRITLDPRPFRRRTESRQSGITLNLASEIEGLLQLRVQASPAFSQRSIHVVSASDGGLRFEVDGTRYGTMDEIPEPQVQGLIGAAISDWEARR